MTAALFHALAELAAEATPSLNDEELIEELAQARALGRLGELLGRLGEEAARALAFSLEGSVPRGHVRSAHWLMIGPSLSKPRRNVAVACRPHLAILRGEFANSVSSGTENLGKVNGPARRRVRAFAKGARRAKRRPDRARPQCRRPDRRIDSSTKVGLEQRGSAFTNPAV